jgi:hypothetical protein
MMTFTNKSKLHIAVFVSLMILASGSVRAETRKISLPSGTVLPVILDNTLSSKSSYRGETFATTIQQGQYDAGLPAGTRIEGVVNEAYRSRNGKPGYIGVSFKRIILPDSQTYLINGTLYSLNGKGLTHSSSGRLIAKPNKNASQLKFIGIGAGAGLVIATLTKGNTLEEMAVGAGLGYLYNQFVNKPKAGDVLLKPGSKFGVLINKGVDIVARNVGYAPTAASYAKSIASTDTQSQPNAQNVQGNSIGVMYGDQDISFPDGQPFMKGGTVYVPLAPVAEAAGVQYIYNTTSKSFITKDRRLKLFVGSTVIFANGRRERISAPPIISNSTLYVPMNVLSILTKRSVSWDEPSQTVIIHNGTVEQNGNQANSGS